MKRAVVDASVVLLWYANEDNDAATKLRIQHRRGDLDVVVPTLLYLEVINIAARRWRWSEEALVELARGLDALSFDTVEPSLTGVATWAASGLTAYDASYVALAHEQGLPLVTADQEVLELAPGVARPLA